MVWLRRLEKRPTAGSQIAQNNEKHNSQYSFRSVSHSSIPTHLSLLNVRIMVPILPILPTPRTLCARTQSYSTHKRIARALESCLLRARPRFQAQQHGAVLEINVCPRELTIWSKVWISTRKNGWIFGNKYLILTWGKFSGVNIHWRASESMVWKREGSSKWQVVGIRAEVYKMRWVVLKTYVVLNHCNRYKSGRWILHCKSNRPVSVRSCQVIRWPKWETTRPSRSAIAWELCETEPHILSVLRSVCRWAI